MPGQTDSSPTIVLGHGAVADVSSCNSAIERLQQHDYTIIAPAHPLQGVVTGLPRQGRARSCS
jgi:hypothetical protein